MILLLLLQLHCIFSSIIRSNISHFETCRHVYSKQTVAKETRSPYMPTSCTVTSGLENAITAVPLRLVEDENDDDDDDDDDSRAAHAPRLASTTPRPPRLSQPHDDLDTKGRRKAVAM